MVQSDNTDFNLPKPTDEILQMMTYSSYYIKNIGNRESFYSYLVGWILMSYGLGMYQKHNISMLVDLLNNRENTIFGIGLWCCFSILEYS